ncbi:hypothetical protein [Streptomyces meridianus]|uniref:Rhodanese domain-containing protein n=1 Tax=Streptomyces meridianus TaxID=2938945 RepID=A0ABT0X312_9ACTN|nr:hypothetical protein [Streptomyces meridianus]MCM2576839.1 hypothetical protein [Streptomyces meridianus]
MSFTDDHLIPLVDAGLGNTSYLLDLGDGRAPAVDASRDLRTLHAPSAATAPPGAVVMCGHGERAMTAAGLLARNGAGTPAVLTGGAAVWANATGRTLEESA